MIGIPFGILGLAAGVYLLIQVKHYGFGGIYKALSWLVVVLSLLIMTGSGVRAIRHHMHERHEGRCEMKGSCSDMKEGHCSMGGAACCRMGGDKGQCSMGGASCCAMGGDSTHCSMGKTAACCAKDSSAKKCEAGKMSCCHKDGAAADSTKHK